MAKWSGTIEYHVIVRFAPTDLVRHGLPILMWYGIHWREKCLCSITAPMAELPAENTLAWTW